MKVETGGEKGKRRILKKRNFKKEKFGIGKIWNICRKLKKKEIGAEGRLAGGAVVRPL